MNVYTGTYGQNQGLNFSASVDPTNYPNDFGAPGSVLFRDPTLPVTFRVANFAAISPHAGIY